MLVVVNEGQALISPLLLLSSSSRMRVINYNWSATKQHLHPQSVAEISRHSPEPTSSYASIDF